MKHGRTTEPCAGRRRRQPGRSSCCAADVPVDRVLLGPGPRRRRGAGRVPAPRRDAASRPTAQALDRAGRAARAPGRRRDRARRSATPTWTRSAAATGRSSLLVLDGVQDPRNLGAILRTRPGGRGGRRWSCPRTAASGSPRSWWAPRPGPCSGSGSPASRTWSGRWRRLKDAGLLAGRPGAGRRPGASTTSIWPTGSALVVGGEGDGLRPLVRRTCDFEARIPMAPGVESLNVSVATGVALFELRRRAAAGAIITRPELAFR